ncbi:unnamed protein product [Schistosoma spindalis]|nr:unnamed protein product [Schistosoma spindale]
MSIMKDFELEKYSNALVSHRKSLIKSDYKMTTHCNNEKRLNFPFTDFDHWDKFSKTSNNNNNNNPNNNNGDSNSLSHIKLPERHVFTASTASLIVHVPSLSYVSEDIDEDLSDHEISKLNLNNNNNDDNNNNDNTKQHNRICPICNTINIDLQQQFDDFHLKRSFSLSTMNVNINDTTTNTTTTTNYDNSSITIPRLWDILDIFSTNSSKNFCPFHKSLSLHYNTFSSITNTTTTNNNNNNNNISSTLTNSLSLPCLSDFDEQLIMLSTRSNENTILHSNNNDDVIYNRNINNTPSISIEYADNISITTSNSQEQLINNNNNNNKLSGETKNHYLKLGTAGCPFRPNIVLFSSVHS